jgi:hypothetical protein
MPLRHLQGPYLPRKVRREPSRRLLALYVGTSKPCGTVASDRMGVGCTMGASRRLRSWH